MTKWSEFSTQEKDAIVDAAFVAHTKMIQRDRTQDMGDAILAPLFDAIVKVADARRRFPSQPSSVDVAGMRIGVTTDPETRGRVVFAGGDHSSAVHRSELEDMKRNHGRRLSMLECDDSEEMKSLRQRLATLEQQLIGRNPSGSRISELEARLSTVEDGFSEALAKISQLTPPRLREAPSFMPAADVAERLSALEGTIDVGFEELRTQIVALTPQRLRNARSEFHEDGRDGFFFTPDEWKKLPLDLKRRWWKETEYGTTSPSADLRLEVNKVLPSHFADVPTIVDTLTMTQEMADAVDALDPVDRDFEEPNPLDITAAAPFSAFAGDDGMKPHHVEAFVQEARDRTKAAFEASQSSGEENNVDQSEGA